MKKLIFALLIILSSSTLAAESRCGWLENNSQGNWQFTDAEATWTIASKQNGATLDEASWNKIPSFKYNEFVKTEASYGYACSCLSVNVDKEQKRITQIYGGQHLAIKNCEIDAALPPKKQNNF